MEYFLIKPNGELTGTYSIEQVRTMLAAGSIGHDTRYWHEGIDGWQPIDRIEESLNFQAPPPPKTPPTIPAYKVAFALKAVPPPSNRPEKPAVADPEPRKPEAPSVPVPAHYVSPALEAGLPAVELPTPAPRPATQSSPQRPSPKSLRVTDRLFYAGLGAVLMLALLRGPDALRLLIDTFTNKITITVTNNFALHDVVAIKSFSQDMQSSPIVESLKTQISQTTDSVALDRLRIGLQNELNRHADEIRQEYLRSNSAQAIEPGTYPILAYFDVQGAPTTPRKDQDVWVSIPYRDQTIYVFKPASSSPVLQSP